MYKSWGAWILVEIHHLDENIFLKASFQINTQCFINHLRQEELTARNIVRAGDVKTDSYFRARCNNNHNVHVY